MVAGGLGEGGEASGSSSGIRSSTVSQSPSQVDGHFCKLQMKAYAKIGVVKPPPPAERLSIPVMVTRSSDRLRFPEERSDQLGDEEVIAPVKPNLTYMSQGNKKLVSDWVDQSQAMRGITTLVSVLETAASTLSARESNEKMPRDGYIIVISNGNEHSIGSLLSWRLRCVHAFGFCDANNSSTMRAIASNRDSTYGVLDDGGGITRAFVGSMDSIISSAVEPIEVKLECNEKVRLSAIDAPRITYLISYDKKMGFVWGNARAAAATNFIVYVTNLPDGNVHDHSALRSLLSVEVKRRADGASLEKIIVVSVEQGTKGSKEVAAEMVRSEAVRIVAGVAVEGKCCEVFHNAADDLRRRWTDLINESDYGKEAHGHPLISDLSAQMQDMETRLHNNYLWLEYLHSWWSHQWWQLPLQPRFMEKHQPEEAADYMDDPLVQLRIVLAKADAVPEEVRQPAGDLLPVLIHVKAPVAGLAKKKRAPVDMVAVLDISSYEARETRLDLLNTAMGYVMERLSHYDRLALIPSSAASQPPAAATASPLGVLHNMDELMRSKYTDLLSSVLVTSTDNDLPHQTSRWRLQLIKQYMGRRPPVAETVSGSNTNTPTLSESLAHAYKILDERPSDDKNRYPGIVIVISDRDKFSDDEQQRLKALITFNYNTSVDIFGFCRVNLDEDTARLMHQVASKSNGIYAIVDEYDNDHRNQITEAFMDCINKITSVIVDDVRVSIRCTSKTTLRAIESGRFRSSIDHGSNSGSILVGPLYAGAEKRFMAYVDNVDHHSGASKLFTVEAMCQHIMHPSCRRDKGDDARVVICKPNEATVESTEVVKEIVRIKAVKIASAITDPKTKKEDVLDDLQGLRKSLIREGLSRPDEDDVRLRLRPEGFALQSAAIIGDQSIASMLQWLSFQKLSEQPPMAPTMSSSEPSTSAAADLGQDGRTRSIQNLLARRPRYVSPTLGRASRS
uniref:VWFA domain-containing protein n=1 Tax=Oryza brachyantha TaxID=4533 RepID=J3MI92_ORYBR